MDDHTTAGKLRAICDELSERFLERTDVVRTLMVTLLAGQHSLLLGPPGTAKSELARDLTGRFEGAAYWEILLSKFTAPTRMFGPIDVAALARGEYRQVYDGRATTADVAFIDEIFKCSTAALNETLGYLNERIYHPESGGEPIRCPPHRGDHGEQRTAERRRYGRDLRPAAGTDRGRVSGRPRELRRAGPLRRHPPGRVGLRTGTDHGRTGRVAARRDRGRPGRRRAGRDRRRGVYVAGGPAP